MDNFIIFTAYVAYVLIAVYLFKALVIPLLKSLSFNTCYFMALHKNKCIKQGRHHAVLWDLFKNVFKKWLMFMDGRYGYESISSNGFVWTGIFSFKIYIIEDKET